jgi:hypothetical protein
MKRHHCFALLAAALFCGLYVYLSAPSPAYAGQVSLDQVEVKIEAHDSDGWGWTMTSQVGVDSTTGEFDADLGKRGRPSTDTVQGHTPFYTEGLTPGGQEGIVVSGNVDPIISTSFSVTNNTLAVQIYTFTFTLPVPPQAPFTFTAGSTGITATDNNGDGATVGPVAGRPTYYSQIDGIDFKDLTITPIVAGPLDTATNSANFGLLPSPPSFPGPAVVSTIGIRYDFSLTPGDSAGVTGVFMVQPREDNIPEPASATLVGLAMVMFAVCRRRLA